MFGIAKPHLIFDGSYKFQQSGLLYGVCNMHKFEMRIKNNTEHAGSSCNNK